MMLKMRAVAAAVLALCLAGCAGMGTPQPACNDAAGIQASTRAIPDNFRKVTTYQGPVCGGMSSSRHFLRAFANEDLQAVYQIYVVELTGEWKFLSDAYSSDGDRLPTQVIDRKMGGCSAHGCAMYEHVGISVTRAFLDRHRDDGFQVKVIGTHGATIRTFSPQYIQGFLAALPALK